MFSNISPIIVNLIKSKRFENFLRKVNKIEKINNYKFKKKNIVLFEFTSMFTTHITYSHLVSPVKLAYNSEAYGVTTSLINKKKFILYKILNFLKLFHFGIFNSLEIKKIIFLQKESTSKKIKKYPLNKKKFLNFRYKGVIVGDLIYDSFLRYNFESTVDLKDKKFINFFYSSLDYFDSIIKVFKKYKINAVFLTHTVYLPAFIGRMALKTNADFYCSGITHLIKLSKKNFHIHNHRNYSQEFEKIPKQKKTIYLNQSKEEISKLLNGKKNFNMGALKESPFHKKINKNLIKRSKKLKVLVATQCLIDSPHAFGNWFFSDFVEWLEFLGKMSNKTDYDWYIKPHPNNFRRNKKFVEYFLKKYPKFNLIPLNTSHYSLKNKIDFVLTNWGNIGMDLALLNIKVLNTHNNGRFSSFNFNINSSSLTEYKNTILNLNKFTNFKINREEVYASYFMHNFYYGPSWLIKNYVREMVGFGWHKKDTVEIYDYWMSNFNEKIYFKKIKEIERIILNLQKNKNYSKLSVVNNLLN